MGRRGLHLAARLALGQVPRSDAPELVVLYSSVELDGSELDVGNLNTAPGRVLTWTVRNDGQSTLHGTASIANPSNLTSGTVTTGATYAVAPGGTASVQATLDAAATGAGSFDLVFTGLTIPVVFDGVEQDIEVSVAGSPVADGGTVSVADMIIGTPVEVEITIGSKLSAGDDLTISDVTLGTPVNASDVSSDWASVSGGNDVVLAPGETVVVTVTYTPTSDSPSIPVSVENDDPTPGSDPWTLALEGTAESAEVLGDWHEWDDTMIGGGAPTADPHAEFQGLTYAAGVGYEGDADFGTAVRNGVDEGIPWVEPLDAVEPAAADDWSTGLEIQIDGGPTVSKRAFGAGIADGLGDVAAASIGENTSGTATFGLHTTGSTEGTGTGSPVRVRLLHVPFPSSTAPCLGDVIVHGRAAGDAPITVNRALSRVTTGGVPSVALFLGTYSGGATCDGPSGAPTRIWSRGFTVPRLPWDGGPVGTALGQWQRLPFGSATPTSDPDGVLVSGTTGDAWDLTVDSAKGTTNLGWDPASGNKRCLFHVAAPGTIVVDGSLPLLYAIEVLAGTDLGAYATRLGVGWRKTGGDGYCGGITITATTTKAAFLVSANASHGGSTNQTATVGVRGTLAANRASGGTSYVGGATVLPVSASEVVVSGGQAAGTGGIHSTSYTGDLQLFVAAWTNSGGLTGNRRIVGGIWICNLDAPRTANPP